MDQIASRSDYETLKKQVHSLLESKGISASDAEEIIASDTMDKAILN
jgi:hypothetical protein